MRPNGVQAVLTAVLESSGASSSSPDWRKCDMVAMVIASCPLQANSMDEYYQHISPQVMRLLHAKHEQLAKQFVRVASSTVRAMLKRNTNLAKTYFLNVLMAPLLRVTESSGNLILLQSKDMKRAPSKHHYSIHYSILGRFKSEFKLRNLIGLLIGF
ncbi:Transport and Golgi organization protein 6-like [Exaiptasia diaphana]|nr:Transport and Golgi organization protein 6-like [Exaiptasia diaphana]